MRPPPPDTWPPLVYDAAPPANRTTVRPTPVVLSPEVAEHILGPMSITAGLEAERTAAAGVGGGGGGLGAAAIVGIVVGALALALAAALFALWSRRSSKPYPRGPADGQSGDAMLVGFPSGSAATDTSNSSTPKVRFAAFCTTARW